LAPAFLSCDRNDLGSAWYQVYQETLAPALFIFDRIPGGIGLAEGVYSNLNPILIAAEQRLSQCECQDGCPGCLFSYGCEIGNEYLDKRATINLIRLILRDSKGIV
jgi:DEAD/DEAH box helicase domain-containing protein